MEQHIYKHLEPFITEAGQLINGLEIAYHTAGEFTPASKVLWVCHALTANSNPEEWWPGMVGPGCFYNPDDYFIICANIIGSCYGSTGPLSIDPATGKPYYRSFPVLTVRDMAKAHDCLRRHLNIRHIHTLIGSSIGGFQALELALLQLDVPAHLVLIATNARVTPWATAFNEAQRMAVMADPSYVQDRADGGRTGMEAARAMALISYRSYEGYNSTQPEADNDTLYAARAVSYQQYQGRKLGRRFNAYSYVVLSKAFDSHNTGRGRGGVVQALRQIKARTLLVGITTDLLFPPAEQQFMAQHITNATYREIASDFGHDGFLLESAQLSRVIGEFYEDIMN